MNRRKVCVVTGTRADYGLLYPILKHIESSDKLQLQIIVTTMHLSAEFGLTCERIKKDGFNLDEKIENLLSANTKSSVAKSTGLATILLSDAFHRLHPEIVLILGDRFETHAAATTAMLMSIPIAHIHGGEITEGAIDEQIRHSITKMSNLHFCSTEDHRRRVIQMGEDASKVFNTGAPGIDNIKRLELLSKNNLENLLGWHFGDRSALFTYHPETLNEADLMSDLGRMFQILKMQDLNILFTYANADAKGKLINQKIEEFCQNKDPRYKVVKNLGQIKYLSAMKYVNLMIGNTSSGIIEAASFNKAVVNIGQRQKGRQRSGNVIDCQIDTLDRSISLALSDEFQNKVKEVQNVYGSGNAASSIVNQLVKQPLSVVKEFVDIEL